MYGAQPSSSCLGPYSSFALVAGAVLAGRNVAALHGSARSPAAGVLFRGREKGGLMRMGHRRATVVLAVAAVLTTGGACQRQVDETPSPRPEPVQLVVHNNGYFDVDIFAIPSAVGTPIRLAMVSGSSTARISVPRRAMESDAIMRL